MESLGAQKLSIAIFCIRHWKRLVDSGSCKKPLRLIFALHAVFSSIFDLLTIYKYNQRLTGKGNKKNKLSYIQHRLICREKGSEGLFMR